jgi:hypothetical protein
MTHTFAAHFAVSDFYTAFVAHNALISDTFILSAVTFPIFARSEYTLAKKTIALRLLSTVVYGFGLCYLAITPFPDFLGTGYAYAHRIKIV